MRPVAAAYLPFYHILHLLSDLAGTASDTEAARLAPGVNTVPVSSGVRHGLSRDFKAGD